MRNNISRCLIKELHETAAELNISPNAKKKKKRNCATVEVKWKSTRFDSSFRYKSYRFDVAFFDVA